MRTIRLSYPQSLLEEKFPETAAAIGFFDGIHRGHQEVIGRAVQKAKAEGLESAVITFHPHPSSVLNQASQEIKYITPLNEKQEILQRMDIDRLYIITFDRELAGLSPSDFVDQFIVGLNIKYLVSGFDFTFGKKGEGDIRIMAELAQGRFTYEVVEKIEEDCEKISSTRIRKLLREGNVEKASILLGRPLTVKGIVIDGQKRGRTIGYPTANLKIPSDALLPKIGVYAVKVRYKQQAYEAMASLGLNPTFEYETQDLKLEVHLFDFSYDLYGEELIIEWCKYIRDEEKFSGLEALMEQIKDDERVIRSYFSTQG